MLLHLTQDAKSRQLDQMKLRTVDSMNHTQHLTPSGAQAAVTLKRKISPQGNTATSGWYGRKKGMATDLKRYDLDQMNMTSRVDGMTKLQTQEMTNT